MKSPCVTFSDVSFSYQSSQNILQDVNFHILNQALVSIIGPNGGGKTTLIKLMLGLIKQDKGTITILGTTPENSRKKIGYMPQYSSFDSKFPISAMEVVLMGRIEKHLFGPYRIQDKIAAKEAISEMGLDPIQIAKKAFSSLSGGQKQRILIARALVSEPELLLLDEPTSNVDPAGEEQFMEILLKLNKKMTVVTVSHDLGLVSRIFKDVLCVNKTVIKHPTGHISKSIIEELYSKDVRFVHHDKHSCTLGDKHE